MPDNEVRINVTAKTRQADDALRKSAMNLREMGERVSQIGSRMSMFVTAPIMGAIGGVMLAGKAAADELAKVGGNINMVTPQVAQLAGAYNQLQAALQPARDALQSMAAEVLPVLADGLKAIMPSIVSLLGHVSDIVKVFTALPMPIRNGILALVALAAAAGPVIFMVGQMINVFGTLKLLFLPGGAISAAPGMIAAMGTAAQAALGPIAAIGAALFLWYKIFNSAQFRQTLAIVAYVLGNAVGGFETGTKWFYSMGGGTAGGAPVLLGRAGGGPVAAGTPYMVGERGPEMFVPRSSGTILPNSAGGGVNVYVNYQPSVSLADKAEVENKLAPIIKQALRGMATR